MHGPTWRSGGLAAINISPADIGRRVTIRHRLPDGQLTDVVGILESWRQTATTDDELVVRNRRGEPIRVGHPAIVAARVVAPEVCAWDLQRVAEHGWPPLETEPLGEWSLRAAAGVTGRANSARVTGDPGSDLRTALDRVIAWYARRGLLPRLQIAQPSGLEHYLADHGWSPYRRTDFLTAETDVVATGPELGSHDGAGSADVVVEEVDDPTEEWLSVLADEPRESWSVLKKILTGPTDVAVLAARDRRSDTILATGRVSASSSRHAGARWAGITSIATSPHARQRGIATRVSTELARWSSDRGCERMYLQVVDTNTPAAAFYRRLSFTVHHTYGYWAHAAEESR